jgi:uncharacterized protein (DUF58 family)
MKRKNDRIREYLRPETISTLDSLELKAKLLVEGFLIGMHKSPYHGFSVEFSEHRAYFPGDPIKHVDWKLFGKTEKYFIKKYEEETNLISHIICDVSASMNYANNGRITKFEYAKLLAAALAYLIISQHDAVGLTFFSDKIENMLPPKTSRANLIKILSAINNQEVSSKTDLSRSLQLLSEKIRKRSLIILISDFFDDREKVLNSIKQFKYNKNEVIVFHLLDPTEINFDISDEALFVDMEDASELTTQPYQLRGEYKKSVNKFINKMKTECLNYGIDYSLVTTDLSFDKALMNYFVKRSRLV